MEAVARSLVEYIKGRGLDARLRVEDGEPVVEIPLRGETAEVRLSSLGGGRLELKLRYPGRPGVTVIKCEQGLPLRCVEQLLEALKG